MTTITKILLVISLLVLALLPFANLFPPYLLSFPPGTDAWNINPANDTDYLYRFIIMAAGMGLTILALLLAITGLFIRNTSAANKFLNINIFVFVFYLGWMSLPYWTNGLYQVFHHGTTSLFDPKAMLPMTLVGEIWRLPILLLFPLILLYLLFSLIRFIIVVIRREKPGINNILILIYSLLTLGIQFLLPGYFYWLLD